LSKLRGFAAELLKEEIMRYIQKPGAYRSARFLLQALAKSGVIYRAAAAQPLAGPDTPMILVTIPRVLHEGALRNYQEADFIDLLYGEEGDVTLANIGNVFRGTRPEDLKNEKYYLFPYPTPHDDLVAWIMDHIDHSQML
jgi:hypothetical protein